MPSGVAFDFEKYVLERRSVVEHGLESLLAHSDPDLLWDSMRYSVLGGGKRLRAVLCLGAAEAATGGAVHELEAPSELLGRVLPLACSIELVHAMSLIHDDLPCMDDDDLRRGRPTNHKVYGEATALLAGDALLVLAQEVLLAKTSQEVSRERLVRVAIELARAVGPLGMVGGQVNDMESTGLARKPDDADVRLEQIHQRKTGALLTFSAWSGACLAGADESVVESLRRFGQVLGLGFQIADDLLDVTGDKSTLGKTPGKDQSSGKLTWVSVFGEDAARDRLRQLEGEGGSILTGSGISDERAMPLLALLRYAIHRTN